MSTKAMVIAVAAVLALIIGVVMLSSRDGRSGASGDQVIRFADTGIDGMEELRRAFHEFVDVMEEITGLDVEFYPVSDRTIAAAALEAGDVDLVLAGPTEYLFIKSREDVKPVVAIERAEYYSVVIVPKDSPAQTLNDLGGKTVAFKDPGSTSGHVVPTSMFLDAGMEEGRDYQGPLVDHMRFEMLYAGDVEAMVGGIRDFRRVEDEHPGKYRILAKSDPLPRDIIVARPGLDSETVNLISEQMLEHGERIMEAILGPGERNKYLGSRIVPANDSDYDNMREVHRMLDLPYDQ